MPKRSAKRSSTMCVHFLEHRTRGFVKEEQFVLFLEFPQASANSRTFLWCQLGQFRDDFTCAHAGKLVLLQWARKTVFLGNVRKIAEAV